MALCESNAVPHHCCIHEWRTTRGDGPRETRPSKACKRLFYVKATKGMGCTPHHRNRQCETQVWVQPQQPHNPIWGLDLFRAWAYSGPGVEHGKRGASMWPRVSTQRAETQCAETCTKTCAKACAKTCAENLREHKKTLLENLLENLREKIKAPARKK